MEDHRRAPAGALSGRARVSKLVLALAAAGLLMAGSARALPLFETEPNDSVAEANSGVAGTESVGNVYDFPSIADLVDFWKFTGLTSGDQFKLTVRLPFYSGFGSTIDFDLFSGVSDAPANLIEHVQLGDVGPPDVTVHDFLGTLGSNALTLRISATPNSAEGYSALLSITPQQQTVPEPASAVLLAAGLAGTFVARRRKRG